MKTRLIGTIVALAAILSACGGSGEDNVDDLMPGECPAGFEDDTETLFYVSPGEGDDGSGDGSQSSPWASIQFVVDNKVDCLDRDGESVNPGAPVKGGDTILLIGADGHDQEITISGCYNEDYVKIKAQILHEPVVATVHFNGSAY